MMAFDHQENPVSATAPVPQRLTSRLRLTLADSAAASQICDIAADPRVRETLYIDPPLHLLSPEAFDSPPGCDAASRTVHLAARLRSDERVIGAAMFDDGYFWYFVHPLLWRQGLGRELVSAACDLLIERGIAALYANVARENVASVRLLESAGFTFQGLGRSSRGRALLRYVK
jgi:RimJ/RimL family protein N-acetyltransferase